MYTIIILEVNFFYFKLKQIDVVFLDEDGTIENRYCRFFDENFRNKCFHFKSQKFENHFKLNHYS